MVLYEVDIESDFGTIAFVNNSDTYKSTSSSTLTFSFEFYPGSQGRLGYFDGSTTTFQWGPFNEYFPNEPQYFEIGDCIHVRNINKTDTLDLRIADFSTNTATHTTSLAPGQDTWILWQGATSDFSNKPCCVHPDTEVMTVSGPVKIKDLKMDNKVIDQNGEKVTILKNIKSITTKNFIKIPTGSIADNVPSKDLLIKASHLILIDGKEVDPESLIKENKGVERITLDNPEHVWKLVTKQRKFIMMNGVPVKTWSWKDWHSRVRKDPSMVFWEY